MEDYCIRYVDLPHRVKGITVLDSEGFYNVYINARLSVFEQRKAIIHELTHIERNDFYSIDSIQTVESF